MAKVHVIVPDVGGAFGQKINVGREETALALAARLLGRPVKWSEDRYENLVAAPHSRAEEAEVSVALDDDGIITAMRVEHIDDLGAYSAGGGGASILRFLPGPYKVGKVGGSSTSVITNTSRTRRLPRPVDVRDHRPRAHARHRRTRMPVSIRSSSAGATSCSRPICRTPLSTGATFDRVTPAETLEQAAAMLDYEAFRRDQAAARADGRLLGVGIACYVEPTAGGFGVGITESTTIRIDPSGSIQVMSGVNSQGHSMETIIAQVTAEYLGVNVEDVEVMFGDTAIAPVGATTGGSRNAVFGGGAARQAALEMRERVFQIAAHMLEASVDDLEHGRWRGVGAGHADGAEDARRGREPGLHDPEGAPRGRAARAGDRVAVHDGRAHLVERLAHLHVRGRSAHRARHAPALHRERRLRRAHQPERRRGPDRRGSGAGHRRSPVRALRLRRRRQPDHHHVPRLPAPDRLRRAR